jgi:hypothetical protein
MINRGFSWLIFIYEDYPHSFEFMNAMLYWSKYMFFVKNKYKFVVSIE